MKTPIKPSLFITIYLVILINSKFCFSQAFEADDLSHETWEYVLEDTGDVLQIALPLAAGLTTIIKKDWEGTKQFAFSYATGFVVTRVLKKVVHKERPEGRNLYDAFPSGHTTSAFSGASFIQRRYGWKYGKWAYVLAALVGVSRMEGPNGWHDIWDVLAGAVVGIGSTYIFTTPYEKKPIDVGFYSNGKDTFVLGLKYNF